MNHTHFIGIGGIGMSGLAQILLQQKRKVSGSDVHLSELTQKLQNQGAAIYQGHHAKHVVPGCTVVYTSQVHPENPEILAAKKWGCSLLHRSELLAQLAQGKKTIAVAGTHGKTTTTSLLASMWVKAGKDPSFAIGGISKDLSTHAHWGQGEYFIIEADESDGTFLRYKPYGAIVTNIDDDHLDHYGSEQKLITAFGQFISSLESKERLVWCGDNPSLSLLGPAADSYGTGAGSSWRIGSVRQRGWHTLFDLHYKEKYFQDIDVHLTGSHNALNAGATFAFAFKMGIPEEIIRMALAEFSGVGRRAEKKGIVNDVLVIDDYAHHPTAIRATLQALRQAEPSRRLVAVFQPHRYSRTLQCLDAYGTAFEGADFLWVTDIYGAFENPIAGIDAHTVCRKIQQMSPISCRYVARQDLLKELKAFVCPQDAVVTLGAGDITRVGCQLLDLL